MDYDLPKGILVAQYVMTDQTKALTGFDQLLEDLMKLDSETSKDAKDAKEPKPAEKIAYKVLSYNQGMNDYFQKTYDKKVVEPHIKYTSNTFSQCLMLDNIKVSYDETKQKVQGCQQ